MEFADYINYLGSPSKKSNLKFYDHAGSAGRSHHEALSIQALQAQIFTQKNRQAVAISIVSPA
jgi:hypothetical protein